MSQTHLNSPNNNWSSLHNFGQQLGHTQFDFSPSDHELEASRPFTWELSSEALPPPRKSACRCLESALSVTLGIGQGNTFPYSGAMDLALDVEAQLRATVPLAVQCSVCKPRRGEILKFFSNAMADVVDLFQQLCNAEFSINSSNLRASQRPHTSSMLESFDWLQPKSSGRPLSNSQQLISRDCNISGSSFHLHGTSNGSGHHRRRDETVNGTGTGAGHSQELPSPPKSSSSDQLQLQTNSNTELDGWHILVGRHLIVGEDRKFLLMHLLRRRLCALSNVLEGLIRAMQDLRIAWRRADSSSVLYDSSDALNRAAEIDTRKSMKTASKLYDIIDQLEKIQT